jgi:hypothetical protein
MKRFSASLRISVSTAFVIFSLTSLLVCGSNNIKATDHNDSVPLLEPCELLSKAEAEEIMGISLKEGQQSENKVVGQKICLYEAADSNSFAFLQISLTQDAFIAPKVLASGQSAKTIFSSIKDAFPDRESVGGIGDDAFLATPGLHVLKGEFYLSIGAGNLKSNKGRLISAGDKAVANLGASL